ncbi:MAG: GNAT family N-acetyltransferase [Chitinophagaceae bacterium]|nr:GNAT family N-acetyltransferase [Chitinophagaceae bacterium]
MKEYGSQLIRNYTETDRTDCVDAFNSNIPAYFLPHELDEFELWLVDHACKPDSDIEICRYYVITINDRVVGCGGFAIDLIRKDARMVWGLINNGTHRLGLGKKLLLHRIEAIRDLVPDCNIALDTTQHAASFFEKMGFHTINITKDSYGPGMHRYDMVLSKKF